MQTTAYNSSPSNPIQFINPKSTQSERCMQWLQRPKALLFCSATLWSWHGAGTSSGDQDRLGKYGIGWNHQLEEQIWLLADFSCPVLNAVRMSGTTQVLGWQWRCGWRHIVPLQPERCMTSKIDFKDFPVSAVAKKVNRHGRITNSFCAQSFPWHPVKRPWCKDLHCLSWRGPSCGKSLYQSWHGLKSICELWQETNCKTSKLAKTPHLWWGMIVYFFFLQWKMSGCRGK